MITKIPAQDGDMRMAMNYAWALAAGIVLIDCLWLPLAGFHAAPMPLLRDAAIFAALCGLWGIYALLRPDASLAALIETAAFLVIFTLGLELLSYFSTALSLPLRDSDFAAADHALGFDFPAHLAFVAERPRLAHVLEFAYNTSMAQIVITVIALSATHRIARLRAYAVLFALTATIVIATAAIFPSLGPYAYFNIPDTLLPAFGNPRTGWQSVPHVLALRDGTMRTLPLNDLRGLVSFPSFHTALALVTVWAVLPIRALAVPFFAVNALLIFGAPSNGDHYLCDLIGGAVVAFLGLGIVTGGLAPRFALAPAPVPAE
ncbi:MAG: phosphatase PAP2 family protein [Methylovirgula sp.]|uniref:phosphatase PAP2 family protein n=1 Tax=Methylovirgula sp. TaxID=1978224 RepID=UPI003075EE63